MQQIQASNHAFAAILADGSVVTWGEVVSGGDSRDVQHQLQNVQQIQASDHAFAAILADGSVVTWGKAVWGGDSSAWQDQLRSNTAIHGDGSVAISGLGADADNSAAQDPLIDL